MTDETTPCVLLVDDHPNTLHLMREALGKTRAVILTATSGMEALRLTLLHECALILLDVRMPGMDGYETARLLRGAERTRHTPILFITGAAEDETALLKGYEAGGVDFLRKPVAMDLLVAKVMAFLELYRRQREERRSHRLALELERQQENAARLQELAVLLQNEREEERKRIAHELHDELGSRLARIRLDLRQEKNGVDAAWLTRILAQVDEVIGSMRGVALSLRPPVLDQMGLYACLEWLAQHFSASGPLQVTLSDHSRNVATGEHVKTALFRIAQEALTNAVRHGRASRVEFTLKRAARQIHLTIADDGAGLGDQAAWGMGFRGMEERLRPFGGTIRLERAPMGGLQLVATVPEPETRP
ncbi:MAG: response regulator [Magnetococcales bacterium]|nr:response regulator [Magnetococcales bacterium]